jgi:hypothetical protein
VIEKDQRTYWYVREDGESDFDFFADFPMLNAGDIYFTLYSVGIGVASDQYADRLEIPDYDYSDKTVLFFEDDFNRSDRDIDGDNGWTVSFGAMEILSNELVGSVNDAHAVISRDIGSSRHYISCDETFNGGIHATYLVVRGTDLTGSVISGFLVGYDNGRLRLYEGDTSSYVQRADATILAGASANIEIAARADTGTVAGYMRNRDSNDVVYVNYDSTNYNTSTKVGMRHFDDQDGITKIRATPIGGHSFAGIQ